MAKYSIVKSFEDEATPIVNNDTQLPSNPEIGDEYWVDSFNSILIWTGNTWQRTYTPPAPAEPGQVVFTTSSSSFTWSVPSGITSCSILCVGQGGNGGRNFEGATNYLYGGGGGAMAYVNNLPVTAGEVLTIDFPERDTTLTNQVSGSNSRSSRVQYGGNVVCFAEAGGMNVPGTSSGSTGDYTLSGGTPGARQTYGQSTNPSSGNQRMFVGGGGAAGYENNRAANGSTGLRNTGSTTRAGAGGVGILGSSVGSGTTSLSSGGIYGGGQGSLYTGASYGGGGATMEQTYDTFPQVFYGTGGSGAVRIIYGNGRSFPANAEDV